MRFDFEVFINDLNVIRRLFFVVEIIDENQFDSLLDDLSSFEKLFRKRDTNQFNQKINNEAINDKNNDEFDVDFDDEFDRDLKRINNLFDINEFKRIKFKERSKDVKQKKLVMTRKKKTTTKFIKRNFSDFEYIETIIVNQRNEDDRDRNRNRDRERDQQQNERNERERNERDERDERNKVNQIQQTSNSTTISRTKKI